jgi:hypothetical protein
MNKYFRVLIILLFLITLNSCDKKSVIYHSITGSWRCEENNPINGPSVYMVDIDRSNSDSTQYLLSNFENEDVNEFIYAHLDGNTLSIFEQTFASLIVKSGTGIVSEDFTRIEFDYFLFDGQNDIKIHAIYSRPD